jgi:hypothetical protein
VTDPAISTPAPATDAPSEPVRMLALRLLTSDDDLACIDDVCEPTGARDLGSADDEPSVDRREPAR